MYKPFITISAFIVLAITFSVFALSNGNLLSDYGIINKQSTESGYRLNDNILRQEAIKMALNLNGKSVPKDYACKGYYNDLSATKPNNWACRYIESAADIGLISKDNDSFRPEDYVTRAESLKIFMNAANMNPSTTLYSTKFADISEPWQIKVYFNAIQKGLLDISPKFYPDQVTTRGGVFEVVKRIINLKSLNNTANAISSTNNTNKLCGDNVCDSMEKSNPNLCPKDCTSASTVSSSTTNPSMISDLKYSSIDSDSVKLDLYFPSTNCTGKLPLIIRIHGGAFKAGDKYPIRRNELFTDNCYAVASLNYRLSGEAIFPSGNQDIKSAVRWLRANADKYNLNPDRFGAFGGSAGGYFSSFLGVTGDIKDFDVGDNLEYSSSVQAVVDEFGPSDFTALADDRVEAGLGANNAESSYIGCDIDAITCTNSTKASLIPYVTKNDPPFYILHGAKDPAIPIKQSQVFYAKFQEMNVPVTFDTLPDAGHGGDEFNDYEPQILAFFDKYLK